MHTSAEYPTMDADMTQEPWDQELTTIGRPAADWRWHDFLARGTVTLRTRGTSGIPGGPDWF